MNNILFPKISNIAKPMHKVRARSIYCLLKIWCIRVYMISIICHNVEITDIRKIGTRTVPIMVKITYLKRGRNNLWTTLRRSNKDRSSILWKYIIQI